MNLAHAEIHMTLYALFGGAAGIEMELYQADESDVEAAHDFFNPSPRLDSNGLRVLVK